MRRTTDARNKANALHSACRRHAVALHPLAWPRIELGGVSISAAMLFAAAVCSTTSARRAARARHARVSVALVWTGISLPRRARPGAGPGSACCSSRLDLQLVGHVVEAASRARRQPVPDLRRRRRFFSAQKLFFALGYKLNCMRTCRNVASHAKQITSPTGLHETTAGACRARSTAVNERIGRLVYWCVLIMVLVSAANAIRAMRFRSPRTPARAAVVSVLGRVPPLLGLHPASQRAHPHRRRRRQPFAPQADLDRHLRHAVLPAAIAVYMMWSSWPIFMNAWTSGEISGSAGGLIRCRRGCCAAGFFLLTCRASPS